MSGIENKADEAGHDDAQPAVPAFWPTQARARMRQGISMARHRDAAAGASAEMTLRLTNRILESSILDHMVNQQDVLDDVFGALASAVRRQTIEALADGARTASELAAPHGMTLGGFMKHLHVLSEAGLISCVKEGRTVHCVLTRAPLSKAARWLAGRESLLNARMDALGRHLYHREQLSRKESPAAAKKGRSR